MYKLLVIITCIVILTVHWESFSKKVNLEKIKPLSRLGYLDYSVVDNIFEMLRPEGSPRPDK